MNTINILSYMPYRLKSDEIEIGLGIHGEPGASRMPWIPVDELVKRMLAQITASRHFGGPLTQASP